MALRRFAGCISTVVAGGAYAVAVVIVNPGATREGCGGVARAAIQTGWNMRRIGFVIHSGRAITAIDVAGIASRIVGYFAVVEVNRGEAAGGVTSTTILAGLYVAVRLADG